MSAGKPVSYFPCYGCGATMYNPISPRNNVGGWNFCDRCVDENDKAEKFWALQDAEEEEKKMPWTFTVAVCVCGKRECKSCTPYFL